MPGPSFLQVLVLKPNQPYAEDNLYGANLTWYPDHLPVSWREMEWLPETKVGDWRCASDVVYAYTLC